MLHGGVDTMLGWRRVIQEMMAVTRAMGGEQSLDRSYRAGKSSQRYVATSRIVSLTGSQKLDAHCVRSTVL